jgi:glycosyltransferase involved in cell wall biosynthesis
MLHPQERPSAAFVLFRRQPVSGVTQELGERFHGGLNMQCGHRPRVAVVYQYTAHYRQPIFQLLCRQKDIEYTLVTGEHIGTPSLKPIDPALAELPVEEGGLRWRFVRNRWFGAEILWQHGVLRLALSNEYDAFIFLGSVYYLSTWVAALIARMRGKRVLMWTHGYLRRETGLKGFLRRLFYSLAHGLLLYGNHAKEIAIGAGFNPKNLYVIYNSLDYESQLECRRHLTPELLRGVRDRLFPGNNRPVLLWIGRLTPNKQLSMILTAMEMLRGKGLDVNALFVGDGPERPRLEEHARRANLDSCVHFYGAAYEEEEIGQLIALSDLCIGPGEIGLTCMHALAYGTPVITHGDPDHQMPEYEAVVPNVTGLFFEQGSVADLADKVGQWLLEHPDREANRKPCYEVIELHYNPRYQQELIDAAVIGDPAPS